MINASSISAKTFNKTQLLSGIEQKNCAQIAGLVVRGNPRISVANAVEFPLAKTSKHSEKPYMARARTKRFYTEKEQLEYRHEKRAILYKGLSIASKILPSYVNEKGETRQHSVCLCRRFMQTHENAKGHVVLSVDKNHIAKLNDLIVCDNSWLCPVCSSVKLDRKAKEITQVQKNFLEEGADKHWSTWMLTLTIPHSRADKLDDLLTKKSAVMSDFHAHTAIKKLKARIGWQGYIDSLEIKHGKNGWHPHHHILGFFTNMHENTRVQCVYDSKRNYYRIATQHDKKTNKKIEKIEVQKYIYHLFAYLCVKHGLSRPSEENGVDFRKSDDIQDYLTKQSKIALELTGEHSKTSGESRTQWEILRDCASENKQLASHSKALFLEFA
ncbi:MAG: protein rep, partial [Vagococcus sp.]|nr:protein rep [Vagococcus sp.]